MKGGTPVRKRKKEAGIALLIAIFILLLIGVVAIALVVSSGTESALAGNYRASTNVYYAAVAGLEEARSRLRPNNPNYFGTTDPNTFLPPIGTPLAVCTPVYLINALPGENVAPWDPANLYFDNEFSKEFPIDCGGNPPPNPSPKALSIWNNPPLNGLGFPGPFYKWVRINGLSEQSLNIDTCNYDGIGANLVYYGVAPSPLSPCNPISPNLSLNDAGIGPQVLELTALAVLPSSSQLNSTQKLVQYLVAPTPFHLIFPSALTLDGNSVQFTVPNTTSFQVSGTDQGAVGNCTPGNPGPATVTAVGYTNSGDSSRTNILNAIQANRAGNYSPTPTPNVNPVSLSSSFPCPGCNLTTVGGLNTLVQTITQSADVVVQGPATQSSMPSAMSSTNPMTIVVNGNLTFNGWHSTGYGLLLVTGDFTYDPDASWDGVILVIGTGKIYSNQGGNGQLLGEVFLARTLDASGNPLPASSAPGSPYFDFTSTSGSNGVFFSSCWVQAATPTSGYRILSFHEISQ